jgi:hypothetical protein
MNPTKTVNEKWIVDKSVALSSLTISPGASVAAPEGKAVTMTVDGVVTALKPGTYKGDISLIISDSLMLKPGGFAAGRAPVEMRAAVFIEDGKYIENKSVTAVVKGGKITSKAAIGGTIYGTEDDFNGILVIGDSEYTVDGVKIDFEGNGRNDFIGYGAGIAAMGNAKLTVKNSDIRISGWTRCGIHCGGSSVTRVTNCRISNFSYPREGFVPMWALGLSGTNRVNQLCDNATVYYTDCHISGNGWGTLSVDGGLKVRMYCKDTTIILTGPRARGYGAFSIGDAFILYDHCTVDVQGYPILLGGHGDKSDAEITNGTVMNSTLYGGMMFRTRGGELKVNKKSVINSESSTFVIKGANAYLNIDDAELNPGNGVILQLQDNDDPGMGPARYMPPCGADLPIPGRDLTKADPNEDVFMTIANTEVTGNFFNSTTELRANQREKTPELRTGPAMTPPPGMKLDSTGMQGVKNFDLKLINARVTGIISAASAAYKEGLTLIDPSNCRELSAITQTAKEPVNNGVIVSLDEKSVWTVTGTSYLTSLKVARGAIIKASTGKKLAMTVDGEKKKIAAGTYSGKITITVA